MNRRNFIKGLAGLVAVAASGIPLTLVPLTDRQRLVSLIRHSGVIQGMTFILDEPGPIVFQDIRDLIITNCNFIWRTPATGYLLSISENCRGLHISNCFFDSGNTKY